jgi:hypothetical protein
MRSRFPVIGKLDRAGGVARGTVTVDRVTGIFEVRPLRRRRTYALPLSVVADMVVRTIVLAEWRERRAAKKHRRRSR